MSAEVIELQVKRRDPHGLLKALSVSIDGWAKLPDGRWFKTGRAQGYKDLYETLSRDAGRSGGFDGAVNTRVGLWDQQVSFEIRRRGKNYERRVRWNDGDWEHDGTFPSFNAARKGLRGGETDLLFRQARRADVIATTLAEHGVSEEEAVRRYERFLAKFLRAKQPPAYRHKEWKKVEKQQAAAEKLAGLDPESIKTRREQVLREHGLDDDTVEAQREALYREHDIPTDEALDERLAAEKRDWWKGTPFEGYEERRKELLRMVGWDTFGNPGDRNYVAHVLAALDFPELWGEQS